MKKERTNPLPLEKIARLGLLSGNTIKTIDGREITILDLEITDEIGIKESVAWFEKNFGKISKPQNRERFISRMKESIPFFQQVLGVELPKELTDFVQTKVSSEYGFRYFFEYLRGKHGKKMQAHMLALLKVAYTINYTKKGRVKKVFDNLDERKSLFYGKFESVIQVKKHGRYKQKKNEFIDIPNRGNVPVVSWTPDAKEYFRSIGKLLRKSGVKVKDNGEDENTLTDILRGRILVRDAGDVKVVADYLVDYFSNEGAKIKTSSKNTSGDSDRKDKEIKIILKVGATPVEIQVMTESDYYIMESGEKHHLVYENLIQWFQVYSRLYGEVPESLVRERVASLSRNSEVLNSKVILDKNGDFEELGKYSESELLRRIWDYFQRFGFKEKNKEGKSVFYSYERLLDLRKKNIMKNEEYRTEVLFKKLNKLLSKQFEKHGLSPDDYDPNTWLRTLDDIPDLGDIGGDMYVLFKNLKGVSPKIIEGFAKHFSDKTRKTLDKVKRQV